MPSIRATAFSLFLALASAGAIPLAGAGDACLDFKWDVSKERALFVGTPAVLNTGKEPLSAPVVVPNRLYKLRLNRQDRVAFSVSPAKKPATTTGFAGVATLKILAPGSYRIAVDLPLWMDVAANGALVPAKDFETQHSCGPPHKIVEFDLATVQPFVLQFSNAADENVLLTVTASPPRKY